MSDAELSPQDTNPVEGDGVVVDGQPVADQMTDEELAEKERAEIAALKADADAELASGAIGWEQHARLVATNFGKNVVADVDPITGPVPVVTKTPIPDHILEAYHGQQKNTDINPNLFDSGTHR